MSFVLGWVAMDFRIPKRRNRKMFLNLKFEFLVERDVEIRVRNINK